MVSTDRRKAILEWSYKGVGCVAILAALLAGLVIVLDMAFKEDTPDTARKVAHTREHSFAVGVGEDADFTGVSFSQAPRFIFCPLGDAWSVEFRWSFDAPPEWKGTTVTLITSEHISHVQNLAAQVFDPVSGQLAGFQLAPAANAPKVSTVHHAGAPQLTTVTLNSSADAQTGMLDDRLVYYFRVSFTAKTFEIQRLGISRRQFMISYLPDLVSNVGLKSGIQRQPDDSDPSEGVVAPMQISFCETDQLEESWRPKPTSSDDPITGAFWEFPSAKAYEVWGTQSPKDAMGFVVDNASNVLINTTFAGLGALYGLLLDRSRSRDRKISFRKRRRSA